MRTSMWGLDRRRQLKLLLSEGYNGRILSKMLGVSYQAILTEIKRGTTADEYREKRWVKYDEERAAYTEVKNLFGKEVIDILKKYEDDEE